MDSMMRISRKEDKIFKQEVLLGAPDRVYIHCLMHDTLPCQLDVKMTID